MPKGFIKEVGGKTRMRFVQPGYNADDLSVPLDKVVFDSEEIGTLSVVRSGEVYVGNGDSKTAQIASWSLPYVPFCTFQYSGDGIVFSPSFEALNTEGDFSVYTRVTSTGIFVRYRLVTSSRQLWMRYVAYRLPVF